MDRKELIQAHLEKALKHESLAATERWKAHRIQLACPHDRKREHARVDGEFKNYELECLDCGVKLSGSTRISLKK